MEWWLLKYRLRFRFSRKQKAAMAGKIPMTKELFWGCLDVAYVFVQYLNGTKGLETIRDEWGDEVASVQDQVKEVIHSLPLTWEQKDALYLAHGYAESGLWDVPW